MKKLFLLAAAALALAGCKDPKGPDSKPDAIKLDSSSKTFAAEGGKVKVGVTSSGASDAWTLAGGEAWVTASATSGVSGDFIEFTANPNTGDADKTAKFTFTRGKATADFTITVEKPGAAPQIRFALIDPANAEVSLPNVKGKLEVTIDSEVPYREIASKVTIKSGQGQWLKYGATIEKEGKTVIAFDYIANPTFAGREAEITIASDKTATPKATLTVTVQQAQIDRLDVSPKTNIVPEAGGDVSLTLTANVEYEVAIDAEAKTWLSVKSTTPNADGTTTLVFKAGALPSPQPTRTATVTFSQKGGALIQTVKITQRSSQSLIYCAAQMKNNWAWAPTWANAAPLVDLKDFTLEALINPASFQENFPYISTIAGIEGRFLVRFGDATIDKSQLQLVWPQGASGSTNKTGATRFETNKWYHIAVTFQSTGEERFGKVYIDGVEQSDLAYTPTGEISVNFGRQVNGDEYNNVRRFWVGYSYEATRSFDGMISEVRIWNKALSADEIGAANHFYQVASDAAGLVAYWKFNDSADGTEGVIKDATSNGNHLNTRANVNWAEVSLP